MELIGGIGGWLAEHIGEDLVGHGLVWLLKQHLSLMGMDFQIWIWVVLALAVVILVAVLIARLVAVLIAWWNREQDAARAKDLPQREWWLEHLWAPVFWALVLAAIFSWLMRPA